MTLSLSNNLMRSLNDPHLRRLFLLKVMFPGNIRYYSSDNIHVVNGSSIDFYKGSFENDIKFLQSFNINDRSVSITNIQFSILDESIDIFNFSKTIELNLVDAYLYFGVEGLNFSDYMQLFYGVLKFNSINTHELVFTFMVQENKRKYDKFFPNLKLIDSLPFVKLEHQAEKYKGGFIPVVIGSIPEPGYPIPLYYDDNGNNRKYGICSHNISGNLVIYADGVIVNASTYTPSYDATNKFYHIDCKRPSVTGINVFGDGSEIDGSFLSRTDLGSSGFRIIYSPWPQPISWEFGILPGGTGDEVAGELFAPTKYWRPGDVWTCSVRVSGSSDVVKSYANGVEVVPYQNLYFTVGPRRELKFKTPNTGNITITLTLDDIELDSSYYTISFASLTNTYTINIKNFTYYDIFFKDKNITASVDGLYLGQNELQKVINNLLLNYSNLSSLQIDSSAILAQNLNGFKLSRVFNDDSFLFDEVEDFTKEFPFIFFDRNFKKSIKSINYDISFSYNLIFGNIDSNLFDRENEVEITTPSELFNEFWIQSNYDYLNNQWRGSNRINKDNNANCLACYNRIGVPKNYRTIETINVYDQTSVTNMFNYLSSFFTKFHYIFTYKCKHSCIDVELGDGVLLTDHELGITAKKFLVISMEINCDFIVLKLISMEQL